MPLYSAAANGHEATVGLLVESRVDVDAKEEKYRGTALHIATANGHPAVSAREGRSLPTSPSAMDEQTLL
jgi:ankyrin repeat protein